jgi:hypothetical protein
VIDPMGLRQTDSIIVILAVLCSLTAAAALLFELPSSRNSDTATRKSGLTNTTDAFKSENSAARQLNKLSKAQFREILDRPIFNESRRPTEETELDNPEAMESTRSAELTNNEFKLVGIMIIDNNRYALVQTSDGRIAQRVQVGDIVRGWRITSLAANFAVIERCKRSKTLELDRTSDSKLARVLAKERPGVRQRKKLAEASMIQKRPEVSSPDDAEAQGRDLTGAPLGFGVE